VQSRNQLKLYKLLNKKSLHAISDWVGQQYRNVRLSQLSTLSHPLPHQTEADNDGHTQPHVLHARRQRQQTPIIP